ncbi:coatomer complex protein [Pholiota conissans]|uniref:Coatomer subunit epsilon n=1 Tax=Pholiota conissans TaxID=109636 RepID=A0A9P5Z7I2_9AGAR|nr:coatomer complex protein [Pholiota conissans]
MDSTELYHTKQQFTLGAYKALTQQSLPDEASSDYIPSVLYKARSYIALGEPKSALEIVPEGTENVALKAVSSLARFVGASDSVESEAALEELRDLSVEIEGDDAEGSERDKDLVRVLAGTAFARAGEVEEALETLGSETEDLEGVALIVQIYLSINRPDLAKKQFDRSKRWAEDDLLLQLVESTIGLVTGKDNYSNTSSFYTEQLGNPSLTSPHLLTARGVTRILRGEIQEAKSDLEESLQQQKGDEEAEAAYVVSAGLGAVKKAEAEELWSKFAGQHPSHPLVQDVNEKAELFEQYSSAFIIPPAAATVSA